MSGRPPFQHLEVVAFSGGSTKMVPWHGLCRIGFAWFCHAVSADVDASFSLNLLLRPAAG